MLFLASGAVLWLVALALSWLRLSLWIIDLLLVPLMWLCWIAAPVLVCAGAWQQLRRRSADWVSRAVVTAAAGVMVAVVILSFAVAGPWWQISPKSWFTAHRAMYQEALATDPGDEYYGTPLPAHLYFLAVNGRVSGNRQGVRFFPQWIGLPDDAGGYLYSPSGPPLRYDMYGDPCSAPISLGGDWWMCGMADR